MAPFEKWEKNNKKLTSDSFVIGAISKISFQFETPCMIFEKFD